MTCSCVDEDPSCHQSGWCGHKIDGSRIHVRGEKLRPQAGATVDSRLAFLAGGTRRLTQDTTAGPQRLLGNK